MAKWNKIISGFDVEDETANFGTRNFAENNGSLYETWTLATIQSDNDSDENNQVVSQYPNIIATMWDDQVCIAIDTCITIFRDQTCQSVLSSIVFDSQITSYCLSIDSKFLFVSVENAILYCFTLLDNYDNNDRGGRQIFYIDFMSEFSCPNIVKICLNEMKNIMDIIVITSIGKIYKINGIDKTALITSNQVTDDYRQFVKSIDEIATQIDTPIKYCATDNVMNQCNIDNTESCSNGDNQTSNIIIINKNTLCILGSNEVSCDLKKLPYEYTKFKLFNNYNAMICLRTDGKLNIVCLRTLLGIRIWNGPPVKDFVLIQDRSHNNDPIDHHHQIFVLMRPENDKSSTTLLHLMSFPDFHIIFTMSVSSFTNLVDIVTDDKIIDSLLVFESIRKSDNSLDGFKIKTIEGGIPELRLQRLLRRKDFEKARTFANNFNLDTIIVDQTEAITFMNSNLCARENDIKMDINLDTFKRMLDKINDITFVIECCYCSENNTVICDYRYTKKLLEYICQRIHKYINNDDKNLSITPLSCQRSPHLVLKEIKEILNKLETFEMIQQVKYNKQNNKNYCCDNEVDIDNEWSKFCKANLLDECINYLSLGELNLAALIWTRHTSCFVPNITENTITLILEAIPRKLSPSNLCLWFHHFIPSVITLCPTAVTDNVLEKIIQWSCKKIKTLYRDLGPDIGLNFANDLIKQLHLANDNTNNVSCFHLFYQYTRKNSQYHQLIRLVQAMKDVMEIKSRYKVILPLDIYLGSDNDETSSSTCIDVINLLLNKVHIDKIDELMKNFLQQYMLNNSLQNDKILSNFIQSTLKNSKDWWLWENVASWDTRLAIIIGYIHNIENRLQQTLSILKKAPVPWSKALTQLAEKSYIHGNHHSLLVSQIRFESIYVDEKIILKKYGFAHTTRRCMNLFRNIVKQNRANMIDDIFALTKTDQALRMAILYFCFNYHLREDNIVNMMNIFQQLKDDYIVIQCCQQFIHVTQSRLNFFMRQNESKSKLQIIIQVLNSIECRLREIITRNSQKESEKIYRNMKTIKKLRNICRLKNELNICVTISNYNENKEKIVLDYITQMKLNGKKDSNDDDDHDNNDEESEQVNWPSLLKKISRANELLQLPKSFGLDHLFDIYKDSTILKSSILSYFNDNGIILAEESPNHQSLNKICSVLIEEPANNSTMIVHLRKIYSSSLLSYFEEKKLSDDLLLLGRNIGAYIDATESDDNLTQHIYPIYQDFSISLSGDSGASLLSLFQDTLKICSFYRTKIQQQSKSMECNLNDNRDVNVADADEIHIEFICKNFLNRAKVIQSENHDCSLLKILTTFYFELYSFWPTSEKSVEEIRPIIQDCVHTLLKKMINIRISDIQLGLSCLFRLSEIDENATMTTTLSLIAKNFQSNSSQHRIISELGYEYCRLTKDTRDMEKFKFQRILDYWGQRLINYGISYREVLQSDMKKKREILRDVMKSNTLPSDTTIELLCDFCENFGFNTDDYYLSYLQILLSSWQPKYSSKHTNIKINDDDVKELRATCKKIIAKIIDKSGIKQFLGQMIPQINFYHYEILLMLLELSEESQMGEITCYLDFLKSYTRVGAPTELELEEWKKFTQENQLQQLPEIAKWRLPFLPKVDQFKLITPELNLQTYEKWLTIVNILKIPIHNICILAVKGAVNGAWNIDSSNENKNAVTVSISTTTKTKWSIHLRNSALLKDIKKCLNYLNATVPKGLYYSTAILYHVVTVTPPGADLAAVAKECFNYSLQWQQTLEDDPVSASSEYDKLRKIKEKYLKYTSQHILHTHGLGDEKYINLVEYPEKLVQELYKDETIPNRYKFAISHQPDINSTVDALGNIFSLNLNKIRLELLNEWLFQPISDNWNYRVNDTSIMTTTNLSPYSSSSSAEASTDFFIMDNNFFRACYIVKSSFITSSTTIGDDTEFFVNYLIGIGFPEEDHCGTSKNEYHFEPCVCFRALRVLQSIITDEKTFENYVKRDISTINQYMKTLQYLNELKRLGIHWRVNEFDTHSKPKLLQKLTNNSQCCTPRVLKLILQLYIDYKIDDNNILLIVLERMVKLSLVMELRKFLLMLHHKVDSVESIFNSDSYINAWQYMITDPFDKLDIHELSLGNMETIENCIGSLKALHACPIIDKLEFRGIIMCCVQAEQWHLAAALLPFTTDRKEDEKLIIQEILRSQKLDEIKNALMELETKGILIVQALNILQHQIISEAGLL